MLRVYLNKNWFEQSNAKPKLVRRAPPTEVRGQTFIEKMLKQSRKLFDWCQLKWLPYLEIPSWLYVIGDP